MAGKTIIGSRSDDSDLGDFDQMFEGLQDTSFCTPELIDPSKSGWEIILHFDDQSPDIRGTQAYEDMKLISNLTNFGYAKINYTRSTRTVVISPLENCSEEQFEDDILDILKRYRLLAKAPLESRRSQQPPATPNTIAAINAATMKSLEIDMVGFDSEEAQQMYAFGFEQIICTISVSDPKLNEKIEKLNKLAEEEELDIILDSQGDEYAIIISKDPIIAYIKTMNPANVTYLDKLGAKPI